MEQPIISYILTTRNKLAFLKEAVKYLLSNVNHRDEIIITDGASTDGTKEFLQDLYSQGKIHKYISEPDRGEAHGTNKALLLAQGKIIKILTDDDVFDFDEIRKCKDYMLEHPEYDFLSTDGITLHWNDLSAPRDIHYDRKKSSLGFCGLGWMWRKTSLPLLGLTNPNFVRMDAEYSLRIIASGARIAWYTGHVWARLLHPYSNAKKLRSQIDAETKLLKKMYGIHDTEIKPSPIKMFLWRLRKKIMSQNKTNTPINVTELFVAGDQYLKEANKNEPVRFIRY